MFGKFNFDDILDLAKPVSKIATVVTGGSPIAVGVCAAIEMIDKLTEDDVTDAERYDMYADLADGFGSVSAQILRALEDGKITDREHRKIVERLKELSETL